MHKLTTSETKVTVIHKAVGSISESDILLAEASGAIVIGFNVRPNLNARKLAEKNNIDVRLYNIIYNLIDEVRHALEGMLAPDISEEVTCNNRSQTDLQSSEDRESLPDVMYLTERSSEIIK